MIDQRRVDGAKSWMPLFSGGRDVGAKVGKDIGAFSCAKAARYFLLHFLHSDITFGQVVGKWHIEVAHKSQYLIPPLIETVEQVFPLCCFLRPRFPVCSGSPRCVCSFFPAVMIWLYSVSNFSRKYFERASLLFFLYSCTVR